MEFLDSKTLKSKTRSWATTLGIDPEQRLQFLSPALIVVDMQNDFLAPDGLFKVWGGPAVVPNIQALIARFHKLRQPVFFSRHAYDDPETDGGATARWWKADKSSLLLREGTWHAELHESLRPGPQDKIIRKRRYSAFYGTDLELLLRAHRVNEVVIAGVCTNVCCEATAHDAFSRDFEVYFVLDGTGATDEGAHLSTLKNFSVAYGRIITTHQALESLQDKHL